MLNTLVISPDRRRHGWLSDFVAAAPELRLRKVVDYDPAPDEFLRLLNATDADIVFLDVTNWEATAPCIAAAAHSAPAPVLIACGEGPSLALAEHASGIAAALPFWSAFDVFTLTVIRAFRRARSEVHPGLLAFLPAKAGSGASTIALQAAFALTRQCHRVLLIEADLRSGALGLYLNHSPQGSVQSALAKSFEGEISALRDSVASLQSVDFLLSNNALDFPPPSWVHYHHLIQSAVRSYDFVLLDLPELVNPATAEAVRRCANVLIVSTTEVAPLHFARQRHQELINWGVAEDRIAVILNRWQRSEIGKRDVEEMLHTPVYGVVPNDYPAVRSAILEGRSTHPSSPLARSMDELASHFSGVPSAPSTRRESLRFSRLWRKSA